MPPTPDINPTAVNDGDTGYCAVNAGLVIQLFDMFHMRPSHFRASGQTGAHGVYYDARKITEGRTGNKWGHHTPGALKSFCHFTQAENGTLVPWRELVEHRDAYDGKEGAGPRTGNRLRTENRLQLNTSAMTEARQRCGMSQEALAEKMALPLRFISALENGSWATLTESTARILAKALEMAEDELFAPTPVEQPPVVPGPPDDAPTATSRGSIVIRTIRILSLAAVSGLILWVAYPFSAPQQPSLFVGEYQGNFSGDDTGTWGISIDTNGAITGTSVSDNYGSEAISGRIPDNGQATIRGNTGTSEFLGNFDSNGHVTGTWSDNSDNFSGTFMGSRGSATRITDRSGADVQSAGKPTSAPVTAVAPGSDRATAAKLTGCWNWSNGAYVVIDSDGTARNGPFGATWKTRDATAGYYTITWPSFVDTLTMSSDGSTLSGANNYGIPISATRKSGKAQGVVGTWLWGNGVTITIRSDSSVSGGGFSGTWFKTIDKWVFEWPLIDTVSLTADGLGLSAKNQLGSATAKRDPDCKGKYAK